MSDNSSGKICCNCNKEIINLKNIFYTDYYCNNLKCLEIYWKYITLVTVLSDVINKSDDF